MSTSRSDVETVSTDSGSGGFGLLPGLLDFGGPVRRGSATGELVELAVMVVGFGVLGEVFHESPKKTED